MLTMVIKKPIDVTSVKAVPLTSAGAYWATSVENWGESVMTARDHINNIASITDIGNWNNSGESKQQTPDIINAVNAVRAVPMFWEIYPPAIQPKQPTAITIKDSNGIL